MKGFVLFTLIFTSLHVFADSESIEKGEKIRIGNGWAYTYVVYNQYHRPRSVGLALSEGVMQGLPSKETMYMLHMPRRSHLPPFKDIMINWNPHGHEPQDIYGLPHFDFHFYFISSNEIYKIKCTDDDVVKCMKQPGADYIAPYYVPTPAGVPMMGWHWLDSRSPELHGEKFTSTFIDGYYDGKMVFMEPMITREFMMADGRVNQTLSLPKKFAIKGYYPRTYLLRHDKEEKVYRIVLKNLMRVD